MGRDTRYDNCFLFFDEGPHKYNDSFGNDYLSVTTLLHSYQPKFDSELWAKKKAKEQGVSKKEIIRQWDKIKNEACERGTLTHNGIEDAIKDVSMFKSAIQYLKSSDSGRMITIADIPNLAVKPLDIEKFKEATNNKYHEIYEVFEFYTTRNYTIYSEIGAFLIDYRISGTIDILCVHTDEVTGAIDKFVVLDWKTNRDGLKFESGYYKKDKSTYPNQLTNEWIRKNEKLLPPLTHMANCNGSIYNLQISMYATMVELILGIPCVGLGLCHIGSPFKLNKYGQPFRDKDGYHIDENGKETITWYGKDYLPYRKKECLNILADRLQYLQSEYVKSGAGQMTLDL